MKTICSLCGGERHSWRSCPELLTRKTVPIHILNDALRTLELAEQASRESNSNEGMHLLEDEDRAELGRLVSEGYTSGRLDSDDKNIAWQLKINAWKE